MYPESPFARADPPTRRQPPAAASAPWHAVPCAAAAAAAAARSKPSVWKHDLSLCDDVICFGVLSSDLVAAKACVFGRDFTRGYAAALHPAWVQGNLCMWGGFRLRMALLGPPAAPFATRHVTHHRLCGFARAGLSSRPAPHCLGGAACRILRPKGNAGLALGRFGLRWGLGRMLSAPPRQRPASAFRQTPTLLLYCM
ncbi:MAG: hypothetical protein J3K34DRAFT_440892 [Monoraphidium minutum]|nr:MAG: hypothetical protein J3K34DRAFT_440892 [Monoraphidium minutum]